MKCACCGRNRKLFESFEELAEGTAVCADCSDYMYRIYDAVTEKNEEDYELQVRAIYALIEAHKSSAAFAEWFQNDFMKRNPFPQEK